MGRRIELMNAGVNLYQWRLHFPDSHPQQKLVWRLLLKNREVFLNRIKILFVSFKDTVLTVSLIL